MKPSCLKSLSKKLPRTVWRSGDGSIVAPVAAALLAAVFVTGYVGQGLLKGLSPPVFTSTGLALLCLMLSFGWIFHAVKNRQAREGLNFMFEHNPLMVHLEDGIGRITRVNEAWARKTGYSPEEVVGKRFADLMDEPSRAYFGWMLPAALQLSGSYSNESCKLRLSNGEFANMEVSAHCEGPCGAADAHVYVVTVDASEAAKISANLEAQNKLNHLVMDALGTAVVVVAADGTIQYVNPEAERLLSASKDELIGATASECGSLLDQDTGARTFVDRAIKDGTPLTTQNLGRVVLETSSGDRVPVRGSVAPFHNSATGENSTVFVMQDVSESLRLSRQLLELAQLDALTGLPNRTVLNERLVAACNEHYALFDGFAVLFLDLDRFKYINDSMGHSVGDELLKTVAVRLKEILRAEDLVCRMGGDEFVVLMEGPVSKDRISVVASKIVAALSTPVELPSGTITVSTSVGIAQYPDAGADADTLLKHADIAMYRAKREGRNRFEFFDKALDTSATTQLQLESALRDALAKGDILPHYQPQLCATTGRVIGVEALARWTNRKDYIGPDVFLPLAEDCGLVGALGRHILQVAATQMSKWVADGYEIDRLAVNVSALQLGLPGFVEEVEAVLTATGLAPRYLELEITESALIERPELTLAVLLRLKKLGVRIALDDFGTGYSSLSYLKRFPVDTLKIDRSFVRDLNTDAEGRKIVSAIAGLAQSLAVEVVAEGVETEDQRLALQEMHCGILQGYLFGMPASAEQVSKQLQRCVNRPPLCPDAELVA